MDTEGSKTSGSSVNQRRLIRETLSGHSELISQIVDRSRTAEERIGHGHLLAKAVRDQYDEITAQKGFLNFRKQRFIGTIRHESPISVKADFLQVNHRSFSLLCSSATLPFKFSGLSTPWKPTFTVHVHLAFPSAYRSTWVRALSPFLLVPFSSRPLFPSHRR
jgi:hypothetical protein